MHTYPNAKLYQIAKENYNTLSKFCTTLLEEGYWEKPELIINKSIYDVLDLYVQAVLVNLSIYCNRSDYEIVNMILTLPENNSMEYPITGEPSDNILTQAKRVMQSPPILLQLCGLRDLERDTSITCLFFDGMLNILLALSYLNNTKDMTIIKFINEYYNKVSAFLTNANKIGFKIDDKYIFRKICMEQFELSNEFMEENCKPLERGLQSRESSHIDMIEDKVTKEEFHLVQQSQSENSTSNNLEDNKNLTNLLQQLNDLVGLSTVKEEISSLINLIKVRKLRENYNMPQMDMSFHMVFTGNPGTGKTTVARIVAQIYKELGILSKGNLVETDRSGLVAGYVGQTALKVKEVVEEATGGVLFIDEAYALSSGVGTNDFGNEAIDTLVKMMEDHRDNLVIIVAGYQKEMENFLKANTGLISRFNKFIEFSDYTTIELIDILNTLAKNAGMNVSTDAAGILQKALENMTKAKRKVFGNARGIRNVFEKIVVNQANRIVTISEPSKEMLTKIVLEDVMEVI